MLPRVTMKSAGQPRQPISALLQHNAVTLVLTCLWILFQQWIELESFKTETPHCGGAMEQPVVG